MAYSFEVFPLVGTDYNVNFPYIDKAHVKVRVDGVLTTSWSWVSPTVIRLNVGVTGSFVKVYRETSPSARLVDYEVPGPLTEEDLDLDSLQSLYLSQEALDVTSVSLTTGLDAQWDAQNKKIHNVANPTAPQDAATKNYVDTGVASSVVQAAASATAAAASASTASTSATTATTKASEASTSASTASTAATTATTKADAANTSSVNAATSASNAADSAASAFSSKGDAESAAGNAASASALALANYESFVSVYYGAFTSDPTQDPNGDPPSAGDIYFNSTSGSQRMRVYNGSAWVDAVPTAGGVTSFNGRTGLVSPAPGDYTATQVTNTPAGNIAATTVQAAINELDTEKADAAATTSALAGKADDAATTTALAGKQPLDATLTALAALTVAANQMIYATGADAFALTTLSAFIRGLLDDADAATARGTLGLGTAATLSVGTGANQVVQLNGSSQLPAVSGALLTNLPQSPDTFNSLMISFADVKAQGTEGGGSGAAGAWTQRVINTLIRNVIPGASLASNVITLPAGTYFVDIDALANQCNEHRSKLMVNGGADLVMGMSAHSTAGGNYTSSTSRIIGQFTIGASTGVTVATRVVTAKTVDGFGKATGFGSEIYLAGTIWKIA